MFSKIFALAAYASAFFGSAPPSLQAPTDACGPDVYSVHPHSQADFVAPKTLSGVWHNQLGSIMNLTTDAFGPGSLNGTYNSAVGVATRFYNLTGRYDTVAPPGTGVSVGWVVTYQNAFLNAHSTSSWSGQYFADSTNERILTLWLLTTSTTPENAWMSTNIGNDTFTRIRPSAAEIAQARALAVGSPHPEDMLTS